VSRFELIEKFKGKNKFFFCFEFEIKDKEKTNLTSSCNPINSLDKTFLPFSGLNLKSIEMHESGIYIGKIEGFFEKHGIEAEEYINNCLSIKVYFGTDESDLNEFGKYHVKKFDISGQKFQIQVTTIAHKYNKKLTKNYSINCRARFGDKYCQVDLALFEGIECDKTFTMCCNKFKNAINFRGEPFIPTIGYFINSDE
jgi:hypothetical protein